MLQNEINEPRDWVDIHCSDELLRPDKDLGEETEMDDDFDYELQAEMDEANLWNF